MTIKANQKDNWDISDKPQTQLKLDILQKYLWAWANIIGSNFPKAYFVDCFAGRGKYSVNGQTDVVSGSPLIGIETALKVKKIKQKASKSFNLDIIAIEEDKKNFRDINHFEKIINPDKEINVELHNSTFEDIIPVILKQTNSLPAFFFIDPYGIKIRKETLDLVVGRNGPTEIFYNYMRMGFTRAKGQHKNIVNPDDKIRIKAIKTVANLDYLFGDSAWIDKSDEELLKHFVKKVFSNKYEFVLNFGVPYPDRKGIIYNLIFATKNRIAQKIMKSIMTKKRFEGTLFEKCPPEIEWSIK